MQIKQNSHAGRFNGNIHRIIFWVIIGLVLATFFALVFGILVKFLWGVTLSPIFGIPEITYWQSVGIVILSRLIFGGFGPRSGHRDNKHPSRDKWFDKHGSFGKKLHDRFHGLNPEDEDNNTEMRVPEAHQEHYNDFWEKEGKLAFDEYLAKTEQE